MLATVWGTERFHLYVYGAKFSIVTDYKPLIGIFDDHKLTSTRIDRWKLRLMPYNCELIYRPGRDENNPAGILSVDTLTFQNQTRARRPLPSAISTTSVAMRNLTLLNFNDGLVSFN